MEALRQSEEEDLQREQLDTQRTLLLSKVNALSDGAGAGWCWLCWCWWRCATRS